MRQRSGKILKQIEKEIEGIGFVKGKPKIPANNPLWGMDRAELIDRLNSLLKNPSATRKSLQASKEFLVLKHILGVKYAVWSPEGKMREDNADLIKEKVVKTPYPAQVVIERAIGQGGDFIIRVRRGLDDYEKSLENEEKGFDAQIETLKAKYPLPTGLDKRAATRHLILRLMQEHRPEAFLQLRKNDPKQHEVLVHMQALEGKEKASMSKISETLKLPVRTIWSKYNGAISILKVNELLKTWENYGTNKLIEHIRTIELFARRKK